MSTDTNVYHIYYDPQNAYVVMEWDGYATTVQFKEGTEKMLEVLVANKAGKVLADIKDMDIIGMEDQRWIESVFLPRAIEQGFKAIALIKPTSYFNRVAVESISYKVANEKLQIGIFDNIEEAKVWLAGK
jgi:hypothetical protein